MCRYAHTLAYIVEMHDVHEACACFVYMQRAQRQNRQASGYAGTIPALAQVS